MPPIKILICDDSAESRSSIRSVIEFVPKYAVVGEAGSGKEALDLAEKNRPDIVILDINLPDMSGINVADRIMTSSPRTAIIIVSVQSSPDSFRKAISAGVTDYLVKPFTMEDLYGAIDKAYDKLIAEKKAAVKKGEGIVIAVIAARGGAGASTLCSSLVHALKPKEGRKILVDGDLSLGDSAFLLGIRPTISWSDLAQAFEKNQNESVKYYLLPAGEDLNLLAAPPQPALAELIKPPLISSSIRELRDLFEYIVIDLPRNFHENTITFLEDTDYIIIASSADLVSAKNLSIFVDVLLNLQLSQKILGFVVNRVARGNSDIVAGMEQRIKFPLLAKIPLDTAVEESEREGRAVTAARPRSSYAKKIFEMTSMLEKIFNAERE